MIKKIQNITQSIADSKYYIVVMTVLTAVAMCLGWNIAAGFALVFLMAWMLIFTDDTLSALCPLMLVVMDVTAFYDDYYVLLRYIWVCIPVGAALMIHIFAYKGRVRGHRFTYSLIAVSVSLIIGGIGTISVEEYFSPVSLYYVLGLGAALLAVYLLLCSRLHTPRRYDIVGRFAALVYAMALLAVLIIVLYYVHHWDELKDNFKTPFITYRNFCTTVMLFGLPMPCYFVRQSHLHLISVPVIYIMMLIGGSRSALLFGTIELVICLVYIYIQNPKYRKAYRKIALICALPLLIAFLFVVNRIFFGESGRLSQYIIKPTEARTKFYPQGVADFLSRPILGYGIGNMKNADIWYGVSGSLVFYHNAILQALASLGIVGGCAYLYQYVMRVSLLWKKRKTPSALMIIPFVGVLLMSQTNPGLFCPLPTALLLVMMFAVVEHENSDRERECCGVQQD